jgi:hypothetical protein
MIKRSAATSLRTKQSDVLRQVTTYDTKIELVSARVRGKRTSARRGVYGASVVLPIKPWNDVCRPMDAPCSYKLLTLTYLSYETFLSPCTRPGPCHYSYKRKCTLLSVLIMYLQRYSLDGRCCFLWLVALLACMPLCECFRGALANPLHVPRRGSLQACVYPAYTNKHSKQG